MKKLLFLLFPIFSYGQITIDKAILPLETHSTDILSTSTNPAVFTAGHLYIVFSAATGATNAASCTGTTLTWTSIIATGNSTRRMAIFYCMPASTTSSSEVITVGYGLAGTTGYAFGVWDVTGVPTTSSGADAIVQSTSGGTTGADPSLTLSALQNGRSAVISFFFNDANPFGGSAESGWTEDFDNGYTIPTAGTYVMSRKTTTDNTPSVTASSSTWIGVAFELRASGRRVTIIN